MLERVAEEVLRKIAPELLGVVKDVMTVVYLTINNNDAENFGKLLDAGFDVESKYAQGQTLLMVVAKLGKVELLRRVLEEKPLVDAQDEHGMTALMITAFTGNKSNLLVLLEAGAEVDIQDGVGKTALMHAVMGESEDCAVEMMKAGANTNIKSTVERTAYDYSRSSSKQMLRHALEFISIQSTVTRGYAWVAKHGYIDRLKRMVTIGNMAEGFYGLHTHALYVALTASQAECARVLLPKTKNSDIVYIIAYLVRGGYFNEFKMLVDLGIDVNVRNDEGQTPIFHAANNMEFLKVLVERGADLTVVTEVGSNVLFNVTDSECLAYLISQGARTDVVLKDKRNLVMVAASTGDVECLKVLIETGRFDVNAVDEKGMTALMHAVYNGSRRDHGDCVEFLLKQPGIDAEAQNINGKTALDMAKDKNDYLYSTFECTTKSLQLLKARKEADEKKLSNVAMWQPDGEGALEAPVQPMGDKKGFGH